MVYKHDEECVLPLVREVFEVWGIQQVAYQNFEHELGEVLQFVGNDQSNRCQNY